MIYEDKLKLEKEQKEFVYLRTCKFKESFYTETSAKIVLEKTKQKPKAVNPESLEIYKCIFGNHFHIGHKNKGR